MGITSTQENASDGDDADCTSSFAHIAFAAYASDNIDNNVDMSLTESVCSKL